MFNPTNYFPCNVFFFFSTPAACNVCTEHKQNAIIGLGKM